MADEPNYQLLLEKISNVEKENQALKEENAALNKKVDEVITFNRALLNKPAAKVVTDSATNDRFKKYMEGE